VAGGQRKPAYNTELRDYGRFRQLLFGSTVEIVIEAYFVGAAVEAVIS
jgi:hypothetical protein